MKQVALNTPANWHVEAPFNEVGDKNVIIKVVDTYASSEYTATIDVYDSMFSPSQSIQVRMASWLSTDNMYVRSTCQSSICTD